MEKFIVSARKYRPQNFSTVVGQSHITTTLKNAINNNQLAHAFLFCGPRGVGKTTCARILGKTINCENRTPEGEACNECNSCISFDKGTSLNIHELDAASNNSVDDIRSLVDQVRFAPQAGKYKVYIVDEVHMLSASAFNAFLKTLEEPPPFAIFILATTEKHKILPTILSRCQIFDFKRITNQDTADHLRDISEKEKIHTDAAALHLIAQKSEGCLRDSLSLFDKIVSFTNGEVTYQNTLEHLNILDEDYYFSLWQAMKDQRLTDALLIYDEINRKGFEGDILLNGFAEFLRNMLVSKDPKVASLLEVADDFKKKYAEAASQSDASWIISAINIVNEAEIQFRQAKNKRLHIELVLIRLCYLGQALDLSEGGIKKKQPERIKSVSFRALTPAVNYPDAKIKKPEPREAASADPRKEEKQPARLIIEKEPAKEARPVKTKSPSARRTSRYDLNEIREKIAKENHCVESVKLTQEELNIAWDKYILQLEDSNQHVMVNSFKDARLSINENNCIQITCSSAIHHRFIEAERQGLVRHLQSHFNDRTLTYITMIDESGSQGTPKEERLSNREQYLRIIENYPAVKELKEKLKLEIEF